MQTLEGTSVGKKVYICPAVFLGFCLFVCWGLCVCVCVVVCLFGVCLGFFEGEGLLVVDSQLIF